MTAMNDNFLYQLREQLNPEFVSNLKTKLSSYQMGPTKNWNAFFPTFNGIRGVKFLWITVTIIMVLFVVMTVPPVRAAILAYPIEIAGRIFDIIDHYPSEIDDDIVTIEPQIMSLDDALAVFPYAVKLPTYIPSEYSLDENNVRVYLNNENFPDMLEISWTAEGQGLVLSVCGNCKWEQGEIIAPDSVEEVLLDNQYPAVLMRGGWYQNEKTWNYDIALTLEWQVDNIVYRLITGTMTPEELIEIATSTIDK